MTLLKFAFLLLNLHWATCGILGYVPNPLKSPSVKVKSLEPCENIESDWVMDAHMETIRGNDKALSLTAYLPSEITDESTFTIVTDKWTDDEWFLNFYSKDGLVCSILKEEWLSKLRLIMVKAIIPNVKDDCPYAPGNYSLENFELSNSDLDFPAYLLGFFRVHIKAFDLDDNIIMCLVMTLDIST